MSDESSAFLDRLERRMESGFSEIHSAFAKLLDRMDSDKRLSDARFGELERRQAASGRPSWEAMAVGLTLLVSVVGAAVSWVVGQTDRKAAEEKVGYLESRIETLLREEAEHNETEKRLTVLETKLGLIVAMRP
jgi:tetrahydromethanopterin S-methyltransferase subunit G